MSGKTIIAGAGWAGLSCALELDKHNNSFDLFESSRQLGGRARCGNFHNYQIDNGQHIMVGSCEQTLRLFAELGVEEKQLFLRQPLRLHYFFPQRQPVQLKAASLPAPFHLIAAIVFAKGIDYRDKFKLVKALASIKKSNYRIKADIPLLEYLEKLQQSPFLIKTFWEPLILAILNTPLKIASTQLFLAVLNASFNQQRHHSDLLLFKKPLCQTLAFYAQQKLKHPIKTSHRVQALNIKDNKLSGLMVNKKHYNCDNLVLAASPLATLKLLKPHQQNKAIHPLIEQLAALSYQPVYTIYLYYNETIQIPEAICGFIETYSQWLFNRSIVGQKKLLSIVISGPGKHQQLSSMQLIKKVDQEVRNHFQLPKLIDGLVSHEDKATFSCHSGVDAYRPQQQTGIEGLYLAGDYTQTGYPATLEGAIISGKIAAQRIIHDKF